MRCLSCGEKLPKDKFRCACGTWATGSVSTKPTVLLSEVATDQIHRIPTGPWDVVFGEGGMVCTSVVLLAGMAGAGKSTIALQIADTIAGLLEEEVAYIANEQSLAEIKLTADRLQLQNMRLIRMSEKANPDELMVEYTGVHPAAVIIDSLVGLTGSNSRQAVRVCRDMKAQAKRLYVPVLIINHVAKKEDFGGLYQLQHEVDTTCTLRYDKKSGIRSLRCIKNRYGEAPKEILLEMTETGLCSLAEKDDEQLRKRKPRKPKTSK